MIRRLILAGVFLAMLVMASRAQAPQIQPTPIVPVTAAPVLTRLANLEARIVALEKKAGITSPTSTPARGR